MRKYMNQLFLLLLVCAAVTACNFEEKPENPDDKVQEVNVYTHRHYDTDKMLFKQFEEQTGVKVNVVKADADELLIRLEKEGKLSKADVVITVDAGRLFRAKEKDLLQPFQSEVIERNVPANLRDKDNMWVGLTKRARILAYSKERVKPEELSTYEALTDEKWKGRILVRSSSNIYNQSLIASIIANDGEEEAKKWAKGLVANFARSPKGNDRDQVKAIAQGLGDIAIVNTYYIGKLLNAKTEDGNPDVEQIKAGEAVGLFFPNTQDRGTHINVSAISLTKYAPNKDNATKLIEFLTGKESQSLFASANFEYPTNPAVDASDLLISWGDFKEDQLDLAKLGEFNRKALIISDEVGWE